MSEESDKHFNPSVRICEVVRSTSGSCGFNLTRSKWDPYPWVSGVDVDSAAEAAGLLPGDCVLEVNGEDVLGEKIGEVAARVRAGVEKVVLLLWNAGSDPQCNPESLCCGPMPGNLQRLSAAMNAILLVLECPICLDMIPPPAHQCGNGHLICVQCRVKSERCPICRMRFTRGRSLLADQVFNSLTDAFELKEEAEETRPAKLRERIFGKKKAPLHEIPAVKVSLVNSPKNKFLTRLLGKSSSVENLSSTPVQTKFLSIVDDFSSNLKAKSLSTGEIFQIQTPVSRSPSMSSTHRCGSGFLSANMALGSKRPASYHGSCESLIGRLASDFGDTPSSPQDDGTLYHCPCEADCSSLLKGKNVIGHIQDCHDGPLVQYFKPRITVNLPVGTTQTPVEDTSILSIVTEGNSFFLKVMQDGDMVADGTCDGRGGVLVWTWLLGSRAEADNYRLEVTLTGADGEPRTDGSFSANVLSLSSMSWTEVTKSRRGVTIPAEYLHRNFANEIKSGLPIRMNIEVTDTLPTITLN